MPKTPSMKAREVSPKPSPSPVKVIIRGGERRVSVIPVWVTGNLCVHEGVGDAEGVWSITHAPTGLSVANLKTRANAVALGEFLAGKWEYAWEQTTVKGLRIRLPNWAESWLDECTRLGKLVDCTPFKERGWDILQQMVERDML